MEKSRKKFLKTPNLDGGRESLKAFIKQNLVYPKEALENSVEGDVIIKYRVTGKGEIIEPQLVKGIGFGCDEEAMRLVSMIKYMAVTNRGVRVTVNNRIKIPFRLPAAIKKTPQKVVYKLKEEPAPKQNPEGQSGVSYSYTIKF